MKLSHTKIEKYKECPKKYDYYYNKKLRTKLLSSALFFGKAIGEAVQALILSKKKELTEEEAKLAKMDILDFFDKLFSTVEINGVEHSLPSCAYVRYFKNDYDRDLLDNEDLLVIDKLYTKLDLDCPRSLDDVYDEYKNESLKTKEYSYFNFIFWLSLRKKAIMIIRAYEKDVLPRIAIVHSIEKPIEIVEQIKNEDSIVGFIDMVCDFECEDGIIRRVIFDHKTASKRYEQSKLDDSQQLNIYDYCENVGHIGYIVMVKTLKKPRNNPVNVDIQIMTKASCLDKQETMLVGLIDILNNISDNNFERNTKSCFSFGRRCEYYNMCQLKKLEDPLLIDMSKEEKVL